MEEIMKRKSLCLSLAAVAAFILGCSDSSEKLGPCGHGEEIDFECVCDDGYVLDDDGKCFECDTKKGYEKNGKDECVIPGQEDKDKDKDKDKTDPDKCITTFTFYDQYANAENNVSGVYLVGDFNEWLSAVDGAITNKDANYKMSTDGNGKWTITFEWPADGKEIKYKYYVDDWAESAWKTDASDGQSDGVAKISSCGLCFGNACGSPNPNPNPNHDQSSCDDTPVDPPSYCNPNAGFDWHDAVLYFAFTDRFYNGNTGNDKKSGTWENSQAADWYGGDFAGLKKKVESGYFDRLGVNTLWISSVTKNTEATSEGTNGDNHNYSAYHSYWPVSAFRTDSNASEFGSLPAIEDHFGTMEELKELVDACHKRCIRVLVDFAANHVFKDSPMVSKHPDWFNDLSNPQLCDNNNNWDNYSEKCWFSQDLPDINYENKDARDAMVAHAKWLIEQTGIDGFRVDAVKHMNIEFIKDLRRMVNSLNKNPMFYMVGETFTGDINLLNKYIGDDLLHAQFDFPLYYKVQNVLKGNGFYDLAANYNAQYKSDLMGTFMGNHDVARALSVANGENEGKWGFNSTPDNWVPYFRVKLAWTFLLTRPGVPLIYYGDEAGMPGSNDPDNRRMMQFCDQLNAEQQGMLEYVQKLGQIRREHPATRYGTREDLHMDNENWCYLMKKDSDVILVAMATDTGGSGCDLGRELTLINLLDPTASEMKTSYIDMSLNKLNVFQVK